VKWNSIRAVAVVKPNDPVFVQCEAIIMSVNYELTLFMALTLSAQKDDVGRYDQEV